MLQYPISCINIKTNTGLCGCLYKTFLILRVQKNSQFFSNATTSSFSTHFVMKRTLTINELFFYFLACVTFAISQRLHK